MSCGLSFGRVDSAIVTAKHRGVSLAGSAEGFPYLTDGQIRHVAEEVVYASEGLHCEIVALLHNGSSEVTTR